MENKDKIVTGKNGLGNYHFDEVKNGKRKSYYDHHMGYCTQEFHGMFYSKQCLYCSKDFEARRVDTAFCSQGCQKAHLRQRKKFNNDYTEAFLLKTFFLVFMGKSVIEMLQLN